MALKLRQPYIRHGYNLADAGTHPEDINLKDPIMDFYIRLYATNGATRNMDNTIIDVLDKIELLDGSDVLYSLDAEEILALQFYHYKESLDLGIDERGGQVQATVFKIPMGIGRYHPEICFDPTQYANPQLNLEWDLENIRACGATGFVSGSLYMDIMVDVVEEAPMTPLGFLMTKEIKEFETAAAGDERTELPVDFPYRTLFWRLQTTDKDPINITTRGKHDINQGGYVPYDIYTDDLEQWLKQWYGLWHQGYWVQGSGGSTLDFNPRLRGNLSCACESDDATNIVVAQPAADMMIDVTAAGAAWEDVHIKADGSLPFATLAWPYGDPNEPEEWLELSPDDDSRLVLTQAAAGYACQIFLTQYRSY